MSLTIKNYKKLEGWVHQYKEFTISEVAELQTEYLFYVAYNSIPYTIKIFRQGTSTVEYEMVLRDGAGITQYGRAWIKKDYLKTYCDTVQSFETMIVKFKPKAQTQMNNNINYFPS